MMPPPVPLALDQKKKVATKEMIANGEEYIVEQGFMAYQFDIGPTFSIGIEATAIETKRTYNCVVGPDEERYTITMEDIEKLIEKYGESNIVKKRNGKRVYIIPLREATRRK